MTVYLGRRANLGIAVEAPRKTATAPTMWLPFTSLNYANKAVMVIQEAAFGQLGDSDETYATKKNAEGEIEFECTDKEIGIILTAVLGASPTTSAGPPYTHTYTLADTSNQHSSISILVQDPNGQVMYPLAMADTFEMTIEPEGIVKCTVSFRSKRGIDWNSVTPVYTAIGNKFLQQDLRFKVATAIGTLGAASLLDLRSLTLTIEKNPIDWDDVGTVQPTDILNRQISVSGKIILSDSDKVWRNYFLDATSLAVEIYLYRNDNSSLKFQLPKVRFQTWEPNKDLDDIATQEMEFKAHYDAAGAQKIIHLCNLINTTNSGSY